MKKFFKSVVVLFSFLFLTASFAAPSSSAKQFKNVWAAAQSNPQLTTWVKAIKAADIQRVFQEKGPYTVFAPTNKAFANLPKGMMQRLMQAQNKQRLRDLLMNHVVSGKAMAQSAPAGQYRAMNGEAIDVAQKANASYIDNKARVSNADIEARNGVIYTVDAVIVPRAEQQ